LHTTASALVDASGMMLCSQSQDAIKHEKSLRDRTTTYHSKTGVGASLAHCRLIISRTSHACFTAI
jgi:hypothetical protein